MHNTILCKSHSARLRGLSIFLVVALLSFPGFGSASLSLPSVGFQENTADTINSVTPAKAPIINGLISAGEWTDAAQYLLPHGTLFVLNDNIFLYLLIDLAADTHQDSPPTTPYDYFNMTFDVNSNGLIDSGVDLLFGFAYGSYSPCVQQYLGPNSWGGCMATDSTFLAGFGSTPLSATPHCVLWAFRLSKNPILREHGSRTMMDGPVFLIWNLR